MLRRHVQQLRAWLELAKRAFSRSTPCLRNIRNRHGCVEHDDTAWLGLDVHTNSSVVALVGNRLSGAKRFRREERKGDCRDCRANGEFKRLTVPRARGLVRGRGSKRVREATVHGGGRHRTEACTEKCGNNDARAERFETKHRPRRNDDDFCGRQKQQPNGFKGKPLGLKTLHYP